MAEKKDSKKPDAPKKKYKIVGSDFKFKRELYHEGRIISMTDKEYKLESKKSGIEFKEVVNG
jgi:hypothetical protein